MVEGWVNFPSKGSMKGNMPLLWQRSFGGIPGAVIFVFFFSHFSVTISGDCRLLFFKNNYAY